MKRKTAELSPTRNPRLRVGEPGRIEAGICGDGITVYWETDATHGERCLVWFNNDAVDLYLLVSLLGNDPSAPKTRIPGENPFMPQLLGTPRLLQISLDNRPSREEFELLHDRLVECQRKILQPTESEALDWLAHPKETVRERALSQMVIWRQRWETVGPETNVTRGTRRYLER